MTSDVPPIDSPEAMMLLLAGELPPAAAVQLKDRLAGNPGLAVQFQELSGTQSAVRGALSSLDGADLPSLSSSAAVRQFRRAFEERRARPVVLSLPRQAGQRWNVQWWMYPSAVAALVLLSLMTWWGWHNSPLDASVGSQATSISGSVGGTSTPGSALVPPAVAQRPSPATPPAVAYSIDALPLGPGTSTPAESDDLAGETGLNEAEQQASTLARRSDPSTMTDSIFMSDSNGSSLE